MNDPTTPRATTAESRPLWRRLLVPTLLLAGAVALWGAVTTVTGRYVDPWFSNFVFVIEAVGLAMILRRTARGGHRYLAQVGIGIAVFTVVALLLYPSALFQLTVLAPDYADVLAEDYRERLVAASRFTTEEIEHRVTEYRSYFYPSRQAWLMLVGTFLTGVVYSIVLAVFFRARRPSVG